MEFLRVDGRPVTELCPYTCGKCPHLLSSPVSTTTKTVNFASVCGDSSSLRHIMNFVSDDSTNAYKKS